MLVTTHAALIDLLFDLEGYRINGLGDLFNGLDHGVGLFRVHMPHFKGTLHLARNYVFRIGPALDGSHRQHQRIIDLPAALIRLRDQAGHSYHGVPAIFHLGGSGMVAVSKGRYLVAYDTHDSPNYADLHADIVQVISLLDMKLQIALGVVEVPLAVHDLLYGPTIHPQFHL